MARKSTISPRHVLHEFIQPARLQRLARETGAVVRRREVEIDALSWTLVLGFGIGRVRPNHTKGALDADPIINITGAGQESVESTSERSHDGPGLRGRQVGLGSGTAVRGGEMHLPLRGHAQQQEGHRRGVALRIVAHLRGEPTAPRRSETHPGRAGREARTGPLGRWAAVFENNVPKSDPREITDIVECYLERIIRCRDDGHRSTLEVRVRVCHQFPSQRTARPWSQLGYQQFIGRIGITTAIHDDLRRVRKILARGESYPAHQHMCLGH